MHHEVYVHATACTHKKNLLLFVLTNIRVYISGSDQYCFYYSTLLSFKSSNHLYLSQKHTQVQDNKAIVYGNIYIYIDSTYTHACLYSMC